MNGIIKTIGLVLGIAFLAFLAALMMILNDTNNSKEQISTVTVIKTT